MVDGQVLAMALVWAIAGLGGLVVVILSWGK